MKTNKVIKGIITDREVYDLFSEDKLFPPEKGRFEFVEREPFGSILPTDLNLYSFYDAKYLRESQSNNELNNLVHSLEGCFNKELVKETINKYKVGTSKSWKGASIFWYTDMQGRICGGEIMNYINLWGESTGFDEKPLFDSMKSILFKEGLIDNEFLQKPVFFGEHLLLDEKKPIVIVESERTAIMASMQYPDYTWLATGYNIDLNYERMKVLIGRDVTLCPNNDNFNLWYEKAVLYEIKISLLVKNGEFSMNGFFSNGAGNELSECMLHLFQVEEYFKNYPDDFN